MRKARVPGLAAPVRTWLVIFSRQGLGHVVGISAGLLLWWGYVALEEATPDEALRGEGAGALGALQGLLAFGFWAGGVLGLLYGLAVAQRRGRGDAWLTPQRPADSSRPGRM
jgi:hypothetical protein